MDRRAILLWRIRGIPFCWQLIDCSFGVFGFIPLWFCWKSTRELETLQDGGGWNVETGGRQGIS